MNTKNEYEYDFLQFGERKRVLKVEIDRMFINNITISTEYLSKLFVSTLIHCYLLADR